MKISKAKRALSGTRKGRTVLMKNGWFYDAIGGRIARWLAQPKWMFMSHSYVYRMNFEWQNGECRVMKHPLGWDISMSTKVKWSETQPTELMVWSIIFTVAARNFQFLEAFNDERGLSLTVSSPLARNMNQLSMGGLTLRKSLHGWWDDVKE